MVSHTPHRAFLGSGLEARHRPRCGGGGYRGKVKYGVILADPPWSYSDLGHSRRVDRIYPIMKLADICAMRKLLDKLAAPDCVLFLWITSPMLMHEGPKVLD